MYPFDEYQKPLIEEVNDGFLDQIKTIVSNYFSTKPAFENAVKVYRYDEYLLNTTAASTASAIIYVEIDSPLNYKPLKDGKKFEFNHNKLKAPSLYLPLKTIKENLYDIMVNTYDSNCTIWKTKYAIELSTSLEDEEGNKYFYTFKVLPCLTYRNALGVKGVIYYNDYKDNINVEYPRQSMLQINIKNRQTKGLYSKLTKAIKTIYLNISKEHELPTEIFETIMYNVPADMFKEESLNNIVEIVNYLNNKNIKDYITLDDQDQAFVSRHRLMSAVYVRHVLKELSKSLINK